MKQRTGMQTGMFLFLFAFLFFTVLLTGCQSGSETGSQPNLKGNHEVQKKATPPSQAARVPKIPSQMASDEFHSVNGWINNDMIIYTTNTGSGSNVFTYNIFTGENERIFKSEKGPVSYVSASPSGKYIMIQTARTASEGVVSIIKSNGKPVLSQKVEAYEFAFEWNPYNENELLISAFSEDWDFTVFHLDIEKEKIEEIHLREPFAKWLNEKELLFLDWGKQEPELFAPLVRKSLLTDNEQIVQKDIFQVKAIKNTIMTIKVHNDKEDEAEYSFFSNDFQKLASFSMPYLTQFSDWLLPYYAFDNSHHLFTFQPLYSTEADTYSEGFQLIFFDVLKGEKTILIEDLENEPLSCSPNGKRCLYGFYFEKLIDLEQKQIIQLFK